MRLNEPKLPRLSQKIRHQLFFSFVSEFIAPKGHSCRSVAGVSAVWRSHNLSPYFTIM